MPKAPASHIDKKTTAPLTGRTRLRSRVSSAVTARLSAAPLVIQLWLLIAVVLVPLVTVSAYLAYRVAAAERAVIEARRSDVTNSLAFLVDRELAVISGNLRALAQSPRLLAGDLIAFRQHAEGVAHLPHINAIVLSDLTGQMLVSTLVAHGEPLPRRADTEVFGGALQGTTAISGVTVGRESQKPVIVITVPVRRSGQIDQVLSADVGLDRFQGLFAEAGVEDGWTVGVVDRNGLFVARNLDMPRLAGSPARPEVVAVARGQALSGQFENVTHEGASTASFFRRSSFSGWTAVVAVPTMVLTAPLRRSLSGLLLLSTLVALITVGLAASLARWLSASVRRIGPAAAALAAGKEHSGLAPSFAEMREVEHAFEAAAAVRAAHRRLEQRLAESEERLRIAVAAGGFGTWDSNPGSGQTIWSRDYFSLLGMAVGSPEPIPSEALWRERLHPDDAARVVAEIEQSRRTKGRYQSEYRIIRADNGETRWLRADGAFLPSQLDGSQRFIGVVRDVTERKRNEERLQLLMGEVNHRAKNLLGIVQAIARQTARGASDVDGFVTSFADRLNCLAASQDLLLRHEWRGISLQELAAAQLSHLAGSSGQITMEGPPLKLAAACAQPIGMALHELATNAAKYGALSSPQGRVLISWSVRGEGATSIFRLSWQEKDGPPVAEPSRRGFGQNVLVVMVEAATRGKATIDYAPSGLTWVLDAPCAIVFDDEDKDRSHDRQGKRDASVGD